MMVPLWGHGDTRTLKTLLGSSSTIYHIIMLCVRLEFLFPILLVENYLLVDELPKNLALLGEIIALLLWKPLEKRYVPATQKCSPWGWKIPIIICWRQPIKLMYHPIFEWPSQPNTVWDLYAVQMFASSWLLLLSCKVFMGSKTVIFQILDPTLIIHTIIFIHTLWFYPLYCT
jgi:hypothetical protein